MVPRGSTALFLALSNMLNLTQRRRKKIRELILSPCHKNIYYYYYYQNHHLLSNRYLYYYECSQQT